MTQDYIKAAKDYAKRVIKEGAKSHCIYVRQACERFNRDLKRKDITLDFTREGKTLREGDRWCKFLEQLPHTKGKWAAKKETLVLSDWQIFCTVNIFGWINIETGNRRFRDAYIEVPRKNGKTFWIGGMGIGMLAIDDEYGAEVYCGATTEKQALEVFTPAKRICEREPELRELFGITVNAKTLTRLSNGSKFEPIIGDPGDGSSPSCAITDEYHEHPDSDQVDTMETGMGAREQPLGLKITTSGSDTSGPCYTKRSDIVNILAGTVEDDTQFGIIYTIDEDDDWQTIEAQKKANPNYGVSLDAEFLKGQLAQARRSPTRQASYKTKHLDMWVGAKAAWMNMLAFQACRKKNLSIDSFKGQRCYVSLDLASKVDIAAKCILFPPCSVTPKWTAFFRFYVPEDRLTDGDMNRNKSEMTKYQAWHSEGYLIATPGNVIDFGEIEEGLKELRSDFEIIEVPYDPFQATQLSTRMNEKGFPMVEVGATVRNFSEPMKEVEGLILKQKIQFTMDPVIMWMFGNVVAKLDKKDNIFPDKERVENKIDGVVSLIMGMNRAILGHQKQGGLNDFLSDPIMA